MIIRSADFYATVVDGHNRGSIHCFVALHNKNTFAKIQILEILKHVHKTQCNKAISLKHGEGAAIMAYSRFCNGGGGGGTNYKVTNFHLPSRDGAEPCRQTHFGPF